MINHYLFHRDYKSAPGHYALILTEEEAVFDAMNEEGRAHYRLFILRHLFDELVTSGCSPDRGEWFAKELRDVI